MSLEDTGEAPEGLHGAGLGLGGDFAGSSVSAEHDGLLVAVDGEEDAVGEGADDEELEGVGSHVYGGEEVARLRWENRAHGFLDYSQSDAAIGRFLDHEALIMAACFYGLLRAYELLASFPLSPSLSRRFEQCPQTKIKVNFLYGPHNQIPYEIKSSTWKPVT